MFKFDKKKKVEKYHASNRIRFHINKSIQKVEKN